jgi:L-2-hydroxyglutarate oxidase LhgO
MEDFSAECVVIGGGVIGLAAARALALAGREVFLIEREKMTGAGTSSRNSEVIHAGIYYPKDSLKARLCVEGRALLYDYCRQHDIPHKNIGKLIVATNDNQLARLKEIEAKARANGVGDLRGLDKNEVKAIEPEITAIAGLFSPSTGIIDSHTFMESLKNDFLHEGGHVVVNAPLESWKILPDHIELEIGGTEPCRVRAAKVVNAGGISAATLLKKLIHFPEAHIPKQYYAKGNYFILSGKPPFRHLVYPVPEAAGLGIHATLDMGGTCRFGPDVEWTENYSDLQVNPARAENFYKAIRSYWPGLADGALSPGYAGMRPKLVPEGMAPADFVVQDQRTHGVPGLINLLGIESPGLTSCLALAQYVKGALLHD